MPECIWNVWGIHLSVKLLSGNPLGGKHVSWPSAVPQNFPHVFQHFLFSSDAIAACLPSPRPHVVSLNPQRRCSLNPHTYTSSQIPHSFIHRPPSARKNLRKLICVLVLPDLYLLHSLFLLPTHLSFLFCSLQLFTCLSVFSHPVILCS